ncbi:hypothetical protein AIT98_000575 [Salmonella enterica subsp. indica]|uniref:Uncharacterized protein n=1 Tax=Salmonella enterica TaxID=28901 RepID=A0A701ZHQ5_SALER|nr:hypothetical protein [Salmonella enterica]HAC6576951.1 hypothetical protein [Salmonella enterica subsp. indica]HBC0059331.1 hypothetical protein [Salmonella enterica]HCL5303490.1 hypothetical protein [Salmonella enterica]
MKNIFFLLLFTNCALANDDLMAEYFNHFLTTFSSHSVSRDDYAFFVSYEIDPTMRTNYDLSPPQRYLNIDSDPDFVIKNTDVLFSGGKSRGLFLNFIRKNILSDQKIILGRLITYNKGPVIYSFKIEKYQKDNVVIFENILALIPGSDNTSEFSCSYVFRKTDNRSVKLVDVNCAG